MDQILWITFSAIISSILFFIIFKKSNLQLQTKESHNKKLLPSPPTLPIIGHLHLFKNPIIHRTFHQLSLQCGSIYSLRVGYIPFVIISSPVAVEECFTKNDVVLANRPPLMAAKHLHYEWTTLGAAPYGPLWKNLRKLTTQELFSNARMNSFATIRVEEIRSLVKGLFRSNKERFAKVEMGTKFSGLTLNILTKILTGKRYYLYDDEDNNGKIDQHEAEKLLALIKEVFELTTSNLVDVFPFLRLINFKNSSVERVMKAKHKMDAYLDDLIEECRKSNKNGCEINNGTSMIHNLLNLQELEPANYSDQLIKGIIMIILIAGVDTSSVTMEWALSLLLNHPDVLRKAREEIDNYKSNNNELVDEIDLPHLPYLQCIVNEALRLFPPAPLLIGHTPSKDITISGYHIAKGENLLINAWAIHRDPSLWEDPLSFRPERFEEMKSTEEYKYKWIPFGLGRRSCPGNSLANRVIGLTLATLIQCFDWERVGEEYVDLTEGAGLTMPKAEPLEAMCRARTSMLSVLFSLTCKLDYSV